MPPPPPLVRSAQRPARERSARLTASGIANIQRKVAKENLATKLADLRAKLKAARREVRAMRATADGLNDKVIKLG